MVTSRELVEAFMLAFLAGDWVLLCASGVEGPLLLEEVVMEALDLKRLRERCWERCGRGMVGNVPGSASCLALRPVTDYDRRA